MKEINLAGKWAGTSHDRVTNIATATSQPIHASQVITPAPSALNNTSISSHERSVILWSFYQRWVLTELRAAYGLHRWTEITVIILVFAPCWPKNMLDLGFIWLRKFVRFPSTNLITYSQLQSCQRSLAEDPFFLKSILRDGWKFDGIGTYPSVRSLLTYVSLCRSWAIDANFSSWFSIRLSSGLEHTMILALIGCSICCSYRLGVTCFDDKALVRNRSLGFSSWYWLAEVVRWYATYIFLNNSSSNSFFGLDVWLREDVMWISALSICKVHPRESCFFFVVCVRDYNDDLFL